ncbi:MAG: hypothetical protein P8Y70_20715 [Candidatus Lokiarchaeota archaeon]
MLIIEFLEETGDYIVLSCGKLLDELYLLKKEKALEEKLSEFICKILLSYIKSTKSE